MALTQPAPLPYPLHENQRSLSHLNAGYRRPSAAAATSPLPHPPAPLPSSSRFSSRQSVATQQQQPQGALVKKASKPLLGWFRKLRRGGGEAPPSTLVPSGGAGGLRRRDDGPGTIRRRALEVSEVDSLGEEDLVDAPSDGGGGGPSDYGRLVASNGVAFITGRSRNSLIDEDGSDDQDSRSIATSLEPFAPSHRALTVSSTRASGLTRATTMTSGSYSFYSDTHRTSSSLTLSSDVTSLADEDASVRPIAPSIPPSPTPSWPTTATSLTSTAHSARSRGWRSGTSTRATTAVTSIGSRGSDSTGGTSVILHGGVAAHIAQVPGGGGGIDYSSSPGEVLRRPSNNSNRPRRRNGSSRDRDDSPASRRSGGGGGGAGGGGPLGPGVNVPGSSATAPWLSGRDRDSSYSLSSSMINHFPSPSPSSNPLPTSVSFAFSSSSLTPPISASPSSHLFHPQPHPLHVLQPPLQPPSPLPLQQQQQQGQAPPHSHPHPRNNPHPASQPSDNASMLTLASSSLGFAPAAQPYPSSLTSQQSHVAHLRSGSTSLLNGVPGPFGGGGGGAPSFVSSLRPSPSVYAPSVTLSPSSRPPTHSLDPPQPISSTTSNPSPSLHSFSYPSSQHTRRRSIEASLRLATTARSGLAGGAEQDAGASVRAVRRKGSWESGESRWSAARWGSGGGAGAGAAGGGASSLLGWKRDDGEDGEEEEEDDGGSGSRRRRDSGEMDGDVLLLPGDEDDVLSMERDEAEEENEGEEEERLDEEEELEKGRGVRDLDRHTREEEEGGEKETGDVVERPGTVVLELGEGQAL